MPAPNPYSVSPSINLVNRSVLVSKQWFDRANLGEAFTSEECSIIERENFIGIVQQVHLEDGALRVKFGNSPNWRHNCYVWVPRSRVEIIPSAEG